MTINRLREDWQRQIDACDKAIAFLAEQKRLGIENEGLGKPHRLWVRLLETWRDDLLNLLAKYPAHA